MDYKVQLSESRWTTRGTDEMWVSHGSSITDSEMWRRVVWTIGNEVQASSIPKTSSLRPYRTVPWRGTLNNISILLMELADYSQSPAHSYPDDKGRLYSQSPAHSYLDDGCRLYYQTPAHSYLNNGRRYCQTPAHSYPDDEGRRLYSQMPVHTYPHNRGSWLICLVYIYQTEDCHIAEDTYGGMRMTSSQYRASCSSKGSLEAQVPPMTIVPWSLQSTFHFNVTRYGEGISFHLTVDLHMHEIVFYVNIVHIQQVIYTAQPYGKHSAKVRLQRSGDGLFSHSARSQQHLTLLHSHCNTI